MEHALLEMPPLRLTTELPMQEQQSPATTQVVNPYTEGEDWILLGRLDINGSSITGHEIPHLIS